MVTNNGNLFLYVIQLCLLIGYNFDICHCQGSFDYREMHGNDYDIGILGNFGAHYYRMAPKLTKYGKKSL